MIAVEHDVRERHDAAWADDDVYSSRLPSGGSYASREGADRHLFSAESVAAVLRAVRKGDYGAFKVYSSIINDKSRSLNTLRGLFTFKKGSPVPLEEVESTDEIVKRFTTGAMSFGSISKEAHETIAVAMNGMGARSNFGRRRRG